MTPGTWLVVAVLVAVVIYLTVRRFSKAQATFDRIVAEVAPHCRCPLCESPKGGKR